MLKRAYGAPQLGKNIRYNWKTPRIWGTIFSHPLGKKIRLHIYWTPLTRADAAVSRGSRRAACSGQRRMGRKRRGIRAPSGDKVGVDIHMGHVASAT